jgi:hypothetical protein
MKIKDLVPYVGRRVLLRGEFPNADEIREVTIVELSPSGKLVKLRSSSGSEQWEDISLMCEELEEVLS